MEENDVVPPEWCDGKILTVEQWGQREFDSGSKSGQQNGIERAASFLMDKAALHFRNGRDVEAKMIRQYAHELESIAKQ